MMARTLSTPLCPMGLLPGPLLELMQAGLLGGGS